MARLNGNDWDTNRNEVAMHILTGLLAKGMNPKKAVRVSLETADEFVRVAKEMTRDPLLRKKSY